MIHQSTIALRNDKNYYAIFLCNAQRNNMQQFGVTVYSSILLSKKQFDAELLIHCPAVETVS